MIPETQKLFIENAVSIFKGDQRFEALLGAGSMITGNMDAFSDVDLIAVYNPAEKSSVMRDRLDILQKLGTLISSFTGEHVGEPRVLICLYKDPLLHVDVKFISPDDLVQRIEDPKILFDRHGHISKIYASSAPKHPMPDIQWIEDRFWTWIHYAGQRLGRGEIFEAIDMLSFLRANVLGPLALVEAGQLPRGVRRLETLSPGFSQTLKETVPEYSKESCLACLGISMELYEKLRSRYPGLRSNTEAEKASKKYLADL